MSRRSSFALLSGTTVTGLALAAMTLAFAPTASADDGPPLGQLSASPGSPTVGQTVQINGGGCFDPLNQSIAASADPAAAPAVDDPQPAGGTVSLTITGPENFSTDASADASNDGSWSSTQFTIGDVAGEYTVNATCTLAAVLGQPLTYDYLPLTLDVTDPTPPPADDPQVSCVGCDKVTAGKAITVGGSDFPASGTATIEVAGTTNTTPIDANGNLTPKSVTIPANTAPGTITGTVSSGAASKTFSVTVEKDTSVDGPVPGNPTTSPTTPPTTTDPGTDPGTDGNSDNGGFDSTGGSQYDTTPTYTSSKPTLPNTGVDSLWPGVIGASLLVAGGGLVWFGRRRPEVGATA